MNQQQIPAVPSDPTSVEAMRQEEAMFATMRECECGATMMGGQNWGACTGHETGCPENP